ncbi:MAG: serine/threonine-protein kinase, partial [Planctomycetota bacterium]
MSGTPLMLRRGTRVGKYRIERRLAEGGFASVYRAFDNVEGILVALKIPHQAAMMRDRLEDFRGEVRLTARLDHPNILPIKDANFIDGQFVIATPLGESTLADRLTRRLSPKTALDYAGQLLAGLAHAHEHRIIHCDIKPENLILFRGVRLRLTDFGIARFALRTLQGSGSGTIGYIAPEQAMGKPSFRSDVFSAGLVIYRMLSGSLPDWPFTWPPPGYERLRRHVHPDLIAFLARSLSVSPGRRYENGVRMMTAYRRLLPKALASAAFRRRRPSTRAKRHWTQVRREQFLREFGRQLRARATCPSCDGPVAEPMQVCPWCGYRFREYKGKTDFPSTCPRCSRGMKLDWIYCPWCYGAGFEPATNREFEDRRYLGRCANSACDRKVLMPFMRYCPWCRRKVTKRWKIDVAGSKCSKCGWGVLVD